MTLHVHYNIKNSHICQFMGQETEENQLALQPYSDRIDRNQLIQFQTLFPGSGSLQPLPSFLYRLDFSVLFPISLFGHLISQMYLIPSVHFYISSSEQAQKPVSPPGKASTSGHHSRQKMGKRKNLSCSQSFRKADEYGESMSFALWIGPGLSWTNLRPEVSTRALGKLYKFSEFLSVHL